MTTSATEPKPPSKAVAVLSLLVQICALGVFIGLVVMLARINATLNDTLKDLWVDVQLRQFSPEVFVVRVSDR